MAFSKDKPETQIEKENEYQYLQSTTQSICSFEEKSKSYDENQKFDILHEYNLAVVGQRQCGQTALAKRISNTQKFEATQKSTELVEFTRDFQATNIRIHMFDLIGMVQPEIIHLNSVIVKFSHYAIVCFSLQDAEWQQHIHNWILFVRSMNPHCRVIVVGTKADLPNPVVTKEKVAQYCNTQKTILKIVFCSAKTGDNVNEIFELNWLTKYKFKRLTIPKK